MTLSTLLVCGLAVSFAVELWLHSRILVKIRCYMQQLPDPFGYLFKCNVCLTTWVALLFVGLFLARPESAVLFYALAVARVSTIIRYLLDLVRDPDSEGWSCGQQEEYESARKHGTSEEYV